MKVYDTDNFEIECDGGDDCWSEISATVWTGWVDKLRDQDWAASEKDDHALCPKCIEKITPILTKQLDRFHCEDIHELIHMYNEFIDEPDDKLTGDAIEMRDALKEIIQGKTLESKP